MAEPRIGTAGWSIPGKNAGRFPADGTSLERYAGRLRCAEINSCFHRSHRPETYARWAASVPEDFRFVAKLAKTVTHQRKLVDCEALIDAFLAETSGLGAKLAVVLVQLPPSLALDPAVASPFFAALKQRTAAAIACEPRHPSWFEEEGDRLLDEAGVARVAADPARVEVAARPSGWRGLTYYRLHGSPVMYRSSYDDGRLEAYAQALAAERAAGREAWCIFDNTASSAATADALRLQELLATG